MLALIFRFRGFLSLLLCVFLSVWLKGSDLNRRARVAHGIQVTILSPVQYIVNKTNSLGNVVRENRSLREENVRLRAENDILKEAKKENERFRKMLNYQEVSGFTLIPTEVIAARRDLLSQNLIINSGTSSGVKKDMPLIAQEGVAGKVLEAYPFHANVQLINDPSARTGAHFARLNVPGILECKNGRIPIINVFTHNDVQVGDSVITSGLGGIFPKGLYLGRVSRVVPGDNLYKQAEIDLHDGLDNIEHAFIMNIPTQWKPFSPSDTAVKK